MSVWWAWVVNGAASVLAGALTIMTAISLGFTAAMLLAAALYTSAALLWPVLLPDRSP